MAFGRKTILPLLALCSWSTTALAADAVSGIAPAPLEIRPVAIAKQEAIIGGSSRLAAIAAQQAAQAQFVKQAAADSSTADQITKLVSLRDSGALTQEEYETAKAKALA